MFKRFSKKLCSNKLKFYSTVGETQNTKKFFDIQFKDTMGYALIIGGVFATVHLVGKKIDESFDLNQEQLSSGENNRDVKSEQSNQKMPRISVAR